MSSHDMLKQNKHHHILFACDHMYVRLLTGRVSLYLFSTHSSSRMKRNKNPFFQHYFKTSQLTECDICCIDFAEGGFVIYASAADFIEHFNQLRQMNGSPVGQCSDYAFSKGLMCFNCTYISRLLFCSFVNNSHEMMCGVLGLRLVPMRRL